MALAYHRARGEAGRTRLIGRERGYHGVGFGGISVGGIGGNRRTFGPLLPGVDHLPHTHNLEKNAFTRGEPEHGANLADELERIVALHDASTIAAVIVEPVAGSTGVLIPPKGYLKRLRELCTKHGILLIFDEVITGFGRLTTPFAFDYFDVDPDMVTCAKGLTNGVVPMGAVFTKKPSTTRSWRRRPASNCSTAIPIRAIRWPAPRRWPRSRFSRSRTSWPRRRHAGILGRRGAFAQGPAARDRHPHHRPDRRHRAGANRRQAGRARLRRLQEGLRRRHPDPHHRRHHRAVAAARHREEAHRRTCSASWPMSLKNLD
jgi:hypothetical protein